MVLTVHPLPTAGFSFSVSGPGRSHSSQVLHKQVWVSEQLQENKPASEVLFGELRILLLLTWTGKNALLWPFTFEPQRALNHTGFQLLARKAPKAHPSTPKAGFEAALLPCAVLGSCSPVAGSKAENAELRG